MVINAFQIHVWDEVIGQGEIADAPDISIDAMTWPASYTHQGQRAAPKGVDALSSKYRVEHPLHLSVS